MISGIYFDIKGRQFELLDRYVRLELGSWVKPDIIQQMLVALKTSDYDQARKALEIPGISSFPSQFDEYVEASVTYPFSYDTILTIAVMDELLNNPFSPNFSAAYRRWYHLFPDADWTVPFGTWAQDSAAGPYHSIGNGCAARVAPIPYFGIMHDIHHVDMLEIAAQTAAPTHDSYQGKHGAAATADLINSGLRLGVPRLEAFQALHRHTHIMWYPMDRSYMEWKEIYSYAPSCTDSLPPTFQSVFASFPDGVLPPMEYDGRWVVRAGDNAIALGGDSGSMAKIAADIAFAFYQHFPAELKQQAVELLPTSLRTVLEEFIDRYVNPVLAMTELP